jgi:N-6 DNA Methylase
MWDRWPDAHLEQLFAAHHRRLRQIAASWRDGRSKFSAMPSPFAILCREILRHGPTDFVSGKALPCEPHVARTDAHGCLPAVSLAYRTACSLGMLMHFSVSSNHSHPLINERRPSNRVSSYPNPLQVALLVASYLVKNLLTARIPDRIRTAANAERFAREALTFRILDPSMECGELLLAVIMAVVAKVLDKHDWQSAAARVLVDAMVRRLCADCLWGMDVEANSLAGTATSIGLLGQCLGIPALTLRHASVGNAVDAYLEGTLGRFDAVVNNPPWGEVSYSLPSNGRRLTSLEHHPDSYVAFLELAVGSLGPGGWFGLVVPSQFVAARNAIRARALLVESGRLDRVVLLPRAAFAHATVRGALLLGRLEAGAPLGPRARSTRIDVFSRVPRLGARGSISTFSVPRKKLQENGRMSWLNLLADNRRSLPVEETVRLDQVANIMTGIRLYRSGCCVTPRIGPPRSPTPGRGKRPPAELVPIVRGRDVQPYRVSEPTWAFPLRDTLLAEARRHTLLRFGRRVYVRELCRRDGTVFASPSPRGTVPLHGVLMIVPHAIGLAALVALLNSVFAARLVSTHCASLLKVDFQRVTAAELECFPVHIGMVPARFRKRLGLAEPSRTVARLSDRLVSLVGPWVRRTARQPSRDQLDLADRIVDQLYGIGGCR